MHIVFARRGGHSLDVHAEREFDIPILKRDADDAQCAFFEECLLSPQADHWIDIEYLIGRILRHSPKCKLIYPSGSVLIIASASTHQVFVHTFRDPTGANNAVRVMPRTALLGGDWTPRLGEDIARG